MSTHQTVYSRIASALTVLDFAEPVEWFFEIGTPLKDALEQMGEGCNRVVIVTKSGAPVEHFHTGGYLPPAEAEWNVEQKSQVIEAESLISPQTTLLEIIPLWRRMSYFHVLDGAKITHIVYRQHMDKAPVKAALFALTAELEERMLRLLMADLDQIGSRFEILDTKSQNRARRLSEKKNRPDAPIAHIQNTYFSEKVKMFLGTPELAVLLPFDSVPEAQDYFDFIGELRNELAHGGWLFNIIRDATELKQIVEITEDVIATLRKHEHSLGIYDG